MANAQNTTAADNKAGKLEHTVTQQAMDSTQTSSEPEPKKPLRAGKIFGFVAAGVFALCVLVIGGFNVYMRVSYASFYEQAIAEFSIPGLSDGFIPQDLDYVPAADAWIFSGYVGEDAASPLVIRKADGQVVSVFVEDPDGETYRGHGGGVSSTDDFLYLTDDHSYLVVPLGEITSASDGDTVHAVARQTLELDPAFLNIEDGVLYTGVFYREGPYDSPSQMHITTPDGTQNYAVMFAYTADPSAKCGFAEKPDRVYSIPAQAQGFCVTPDGEGMFSTSWGFEPSRYFYYTMDDLVQDGTYEVAGEDIPLYCFDQRSFARELQGPPMGEGVVLHDNRVFIANESATNKYLFGKLMGGQVVYSLPAMPR